MDPQHRHFLNVAGKLWAKMLDSDPERFYGKIGVFGSARRRMTLFFLNQLYFNQNILKSAPEFLSTGNENDTALRQEFLIN